MMKLSIIMTENQKERFMGAREIVKENDTKNLIIGAIVAALIDDDYFFALGLFTRLADINNDSGEIKA